MLDASAPEAAAPASAALFTGASTPDYTQQAYGQPMDPSSPQATMDTAYAPAQQAYLDPAYAQAAGHAASMQQGYQYVPVFNPGKSLGTASMVLGILSILIPYVGVILGIIGLILGIVSKKKSSAASMPSPGAAIAGIVTSIIGMLFQVLLIALVVWLIAEVAANPSYYAYYY
jgi:hypothetical protein